MAAGAWECSPPPRDAKGFASKEFAEEAEKNKNKKNNKKRFELGSVEADDVSGCAVTFLGFREGAEPFAALPEALLEVIFTPSRAQAPSRRQPFIHSSVRRKAAWLLSSAIPGLFWTWGVYHIHGCANGTYR